jgi:hypothetical protein
MNIIGTEGFVAWFYAVTWRSLQNFSRKTYGKYTTLIVGLLLMILGLIPIIKLMNPVLVVGGLALLLGGIVIFSIPFFVINKG